MQFKFFGGAREVGRSAILLKDDKTLMLDYGIKLNNKMEYPLATPHVDAVALSHAHLDHSGSVPSIYNSMLVPTFGTRPTLKLSILLLEDSMNIAKRQHSQLKYHKRQISSFSNRYVSIDYHSRATIGNMEIEQFDAGHISGSAVTLIERKNARENKRIVYTGDFKIAEQYLHKGAEIVQSDVLITESTYANTEHPDREQLIKKFVKKINEILQGGGNALVPVFAVGRSQEILAILYKHGLTGSTYIDGMAREATSIVLKYPEFINQEEALSRAVKEAIPIANHGERREALNQPSVILTTAGMLNGGPVLNYITKLNSKSAILLTGYQVEGSNGRMLLEKGTVAIEGSIVKIKTPVMYYDFSAHASKSDLHEYVKKSSPNTVICVHGSEENTKMLAESLKLEGFNAFAPKNGEALKFD